MENEKICNYLQNYFLRIRIIDFKRLLGYNFDVKCNTDFKKERFTGDL